MKTIAVVTFAEDVGRFYSRQLQALFASVRIHRYSFEAGTVEKPFTEELILVATHAIYDTVRHLIPADSEVVITRLTLSRECFRQIREIPPGSKAMLVNLSPEMCLETISLISQLGVNHIELMPVYPGMKEIPPFDIAVTPGEKRYVPAGVKTVIDIGHRRLDTGTIVEIALKLNAESLLQQDVFQQYFASIIDNRYSFDALTGKNRRLETQFDMLLKVLEEGIIGVNSQGAVFAYNDSAEKILGAKRNDVLGQKAMECFPEIPFAEALARQEAVKSKLIQRNGVYLYVEVVLVKEVCRLAGAFAIVKKFNDMEQQQHQLRLQLVQKGYRAKYTFEDIVGESEVMLEVKELARRMAEVDSAVLISGESGSGKELFAQAIHNASGRHGFPFVAVNCAAIPENLLESELFGYEEGAFTGAKKGGRRGLFEFAHQGTLFLDEIGEMSLGLQAKLLRILQEKEVVRVGGDRVIKVDVRIIAATHEELRTLVGRGRFRRDLYYRLSVLPLRIPPLRLRGPDILLLAQRFQRQLGDKKELPTAIRTAFLRHTWEGNVRELRNYIERISYIGFHETLFSELPLPEQRRPPFPEAHPPEKAEQPWGRNHEIYGFVLNQLALSRRDGTKLGRRRLAELARAQGLPVTEQEVRTVLKKLAECGMVSMERGRSGSHITLDGLQWLEQKKG